MNRINICNLALGCEHWDKSCGKEKCNLPSAWAHSLYGNSKRLCAQDSCGVFTSVWFC